MEVWGKDVPAPATHPADGHDVVAHQHSSHELGLDALLQQDLLEVGQTGLVDEHRLVPRDLEGRKQDGQKRCLRGSNELCCSQNKDV